MNKNKAGMAIATLAFVALLALAIWRAPYAIGFLFACYLTALIPIAGSGEAIGKNRFNASYVARFPGLGHVYVGNMKRALLFFAADALMLSSLLMCAYSKEHMLLLANFAFMLLGLCFMSVADAERICDELYAEDPPYPPTRFHLAYFSITAFCYASMMLSIIGLVAMGQAHDIWQYVALGAMWSAAMAFAAHRYKVTRHLDPPKPGKASK